MTDIEFDGDDVPSPQWDEKSGCWWVMRPTFENTDDAPASLVLAAVRQCAASWDPDVRLVGNVRAGDIVRAITEILGEQSD